MFDFPNAPLVGDKYPTTPIAGQPIYTWDGEKWTAALDVSIATAQPGTATPIMDSGTGSAGTTVKYAREDHSHPSNTAKLSKSGDAMTGPLTLAAAPTIPLEASTKKYVDDQISAVDLSTRVAKAGDTMTGLLTFNLTTNANMLKFTNTSVGLSKYFRMSAAGGLEIVNNAYSAVTHTFADNGTITTTGGAALQFGGSAQAGFYTDASNAAIRAPVNNGAVYIQNFGGASTYGLFAPGGLSSVASISTSGSVTCTSISASSTIANSAGDINCNGGDLRSLRSGSPGTGIVWLGNSGRYLYWDGSNYNMPANHLYTAAGRVMGTSSDAGVVQNGRIAFAGDYSVPWTGGMTEPWGGTVTTGHSIAFQAMTVRYRYMQLQNYAGTWFTTGYA